MIDRFIVGSMATNCYIIDGSIIVDPGDDAEYIMDHVSEPKMIIATHGHFDHVMAAYALQTAFNIPFFMHRDDEFLLTKMQTSAKHFLHLPTVDPPPKITQYLAGGETVGPFTVIHTPGHTPGSICLIGNDGILTGDTIFAGGAIGRTDFSYASPLKLNESIQTLLLMPPETTLYPGHGESTSVADELRLR